MFRWFASQSKSVISAAILVGLFSFVADLVGLMRDRILAGTFGAGDTLDVYYAAFKVPDFLFNLMVVGALSASFIPLFTKHFHSALGKARAWQFTNTLLPLIFFGMCLVGVVVFLFAHPIAALIAPGFDPIKQARVAFFTRILIASELLLSVSMVFGGVLQSTKRFFSYSLAPVFYNLGIVAGTVFLVPVFGSAGLAFGVVLGASLHLLIQAIGLSGTGYRFVWMWNPFDKDARTVFRLMIPRVIGIGLNQLLFLILTIVASTLESGSVTIFQFAYNVEFFPVGVFGVSYAIAAFPTFSEHLSANRLDRFQEVFSTTIRQLLFFLIPATISFLLLRAQIVRVVVGAGAFDWNATVLAADTLAFFALTFVPQACVYVLARAFFAMHDTVTPLLAGLVSAILGITSAFLFTQTFGVMGLAMSFGLSEAVSACLLWVLLRQKIGSLHEFVIVQSLFKLIPSALVSGVVMYGIRNWIGSFVPLDTFFHVFLQVFVTGLIGGVMYLGMLTLLRSEESSSFFASISKRMLARATPPEVVSQSDGGAP